jgi:transcriptional regulator with XRE-family HTH domain
MSALRSPANSSARRTALALQQVTQEELAERVGVFRTYMSRVETGVANPTLTVIHAFAVALSVPVQDLFAVPSHDDVPKTRSIQAASRGRVQK